MIQHIHIFKNLDFFFFIYNKTYFQCRLYTKNTHFPVFIHAGFNIHICKIQTGLMIHSRHSSHTFYPSLIWNRPVYPVCLFFHTFIEAEYIQFSLYQEFIRSNLCICFSACHIRPKNRTDILFCPAKRHLFFNPVRILSCCKYLQKFFFFCLFKYRIFSFYICCELFSHTFFHSDRNLCKCLDIQFS